MLWDIPNATELGRVVQAVRKAQGLRQDDLAAMLPASHTFLIDVEHGKQTAHIGKVLTLLRELGIRVICDVPEVARTRLEGAGGGVGQARRPRPQRRRIAPPTPKSRRRRG